MRSEAIVNFERRRRIRGRPSTCLFENKFQFNKRFHEQSQSLIFSEAILSSSLDFVCLGLTYTAFSFSQGVTIMSIRI